MRYPSIRASKELALKQHWRFPAAFAVVARVDKVFSLFSLSRCQFPRMMMMIVGGECLEQRECVTVNDNYSQYFSSRLTPLAQGFQGLKLTKTFSRDYQSSKKKSMRISHLLLSFNFKMVCLTLNFSILLKTILEFYDLIQEPFILIKYLF